MEQEASGRMEMSAEEFARMVHAIREAENFAADYYAQAIASGKIKSPEQVAIENINAYWSRSNG